MACRDFVPVDPQPVVSKLTGEVFNAAASVKVVELAARVISPRLLTLLFTIYAGIIAARVGVTAAASPVIVKLVVLLVPLSVGRNKLIKVPLFTYLAVPVILAVNPVPVTVNVPVVTP